MKRFSMILILTVMLFTMIQCKDKSDEKMPTIGLFQFASRMTVDEAMKGVRAVLADSGYIDGKNCRFVYRNAENDFGTAQSMAQEFVVKNVDIIITITTPCLQVTANANKTIPHVFGMVTDPYLVGVAKSQTDHQPNLTGLATFQPVTEGIDLIKQVLPKAKRIGVIWSPSEICSQACMDRMRPAMKKNGLELIEVTVTNTNEVQMAAQSLVDKKVDAVYISGDNTVELAIATITAVSNPAKIPVVTNNPMHTENGALMSIGADYNTVGKETAKLAIRVLKGEKPADIPISDLLPKELWLNQKVATKMGICFPENVLAQAKKIVGK
ncbi:MAG: ABC transporter substrate-binding protein [Candidatus Marinimicrobia bacterium]|nr:ABC transporter substrate-binding protein [Candidatus Neomarinimicrobiota bacterium]